MSETPDPIVEAVREKLLRRSAAGVAKYGVTLARTDLNLTAWLTHLQEELLDAVNYVERLLSELPDYSDPIGRPTVAFYPSAVPVDARNDTDLVPRRGRA